MFVSVVDYNVLNGDLYVPYLYYALLSAIPVAFGSILIAYIEVNVAFVIEDEMNIQCVFVGIAF